MIGLIELVARIQDEPDRCEFEEYFSDVDAKVCNQPAVGSDRESERDYCKKHLDWIGNE